MTEHIKIVLYCLAYTGNTSCFPQSAPEFRGCHMWQQINIVFVLININTRKTRKCNKMNIINKKIDESN